MSVKRSLAWMGGAQVVAFVLQFASSVVLARYLTPYETGIYAAAMAVTGMLALIQALGLQALIVREDDLTDDLLATAFTVNALVAVLLAIAITGFSVAGRLFLRDAAVQQVLLALSITPLFGIPSFLPTAQLERAAQFRLMAVIGTASSIIGTLTTVGLVVAGFSYMSLAYGQWTSGLGYAVMMMIAGRQHVRYRIGVRAWRRVASFGFQMVAVSGITNASLRLSDVLLGRLLGLAALGIYNRASGLNGLVWNNVHMVLGRVMLVDFAQLHRDCQPLRERYLLTLAIVTAALWPAFAGLALVAPPFILAVYGERWTPAATPLALLALASMLQVAISMTWELFTATDRLQDQTRIEFMRAIVAVATFAVGCTISIEAAAASRVVDALFALVLYRPHLNRMTATVLSDYWPIYARSATLAALAVAPAALVMNAHGWAPRTPISQLLCAMIFGGGLWMAALFVLKHPLAAELAQPVRAWHARRQPA